MIRPYRVFVFRLSASSCVAAILALTLLPHQAEAGFCDGGLIEEKRCKAAIDIMRDLLPQPAAETTQPVEATSDTTTDAAAEIPVPDGLLPAPNRIGAASDETSAAAGATAVSSGNPSGAVVFVPYPTERPRNNKALYPQNAALKDGALAFQSVAGQSAGAGGDRISGPYLSDVCLDVDSITEKDIAGQRAALKKSGMCVTETSIAENGRRWRLFMIENRSKGAGPLFVVPHDNEDAAFATGVYGVATYGGTLIAVEAGEQRLFEGQDPNRNFSTSSTAVKSCRAQRAPAPLYTEAILSRRQSGAAIIALHSNANGWSGNGGSGNISTRKTGGGTKPFISAIARSRRLADEDTMIILAGTGEAGRGSAARAIRHFTEKAGVNVLYEQVSPRNNDCSLSNYAALHNIGPYFNIEVEDGDTKTQKLILDALADYLGLK